MNIHFTTVSSNTKTGPMLTTIQSSDTCAPGCPLKKNGCYAEYSYINMLWKKVDNGTRAKLWGEFLTTVRRLGKGCLWRFGVAGDLPHINGKIRANKLQEIVAANRGKRGFTYTHHVVDEHNGPAIKAANEAGFTINLSADTLEEADSKAEAGVGPVVVVMPADPAKWPKETPAGRKVVPCLHTTKGLQCTQCGLCAVAGRKTIVGFAAHGSGKRKAEAVFGE